MFKAKTYDGTTNAEINFSLMYDYLLEGDDVTFDISSFSSSGFSTPNASKSYRFGPATGTIIMSGSKAFCYSFTSPTSLIGLINPAPLAIAAKKINITMGTDPSTIDLSSAYTVTGLVNNETEAVLNGSLSISIDPSITASSPAGVYTDAIKIQGYTSTNYTITYQFADLEITEEGKQTITFDAIPSQNLASATYQLNATASSGLPVSYTSSNTAVATVDASGLVTFLSAGQTTITAIQGGDATYDPATPVTQVFTITAHNDNSLTKLTINGEEWSITNQFIIDCGVAFQKLNIEVGTDQYATVRVGGTLITDKKIEFENNKKAFNQDLTFEIRAQDGTSRSYTLTIEKYFNFTDIVTQAGNILTVNNNPATNGGYAFTAFKWFKDGTDVGNGASHVIDSKASYSLEVVTDAAETLHTCPMIVVPTNNSKANIIISPNPVTAQKSVSINLLNYQGGQDGIKIEIYDLNGNKIGTEVEISANMATFNAPANPGKYVVHVITTGSLSDVRMVVLYVL